MVADCGSGIAKYILCLFNFIFFLLGTIVLGAGVWLAADKASLIALLKMVENEHIEQFTQPAVIEQMAYVLIACGALMFILSFLGYCGAMRESPCLLTTYAIFLILILGAEITVGGIAAAYKEKAQMETKTFLRSTITRYYSSAEHTDAVTLMWNHLMSQLKCCGVEDYSDFDSSESWRKNKGNRTVPEACCYLTDRSIFKPQDPNCPVSPSDSNSYYRKGCYDAFINWVIENRNIVIGVGIGIGIIQLFAIFLAFCLCKSINTFRSMRL